MKENISFYHVYSGTLNPCSVDKESYKKAQHSWLCSQCLSPRESWETVDFEIQESAPDDPPLNFVNGCGLGVVRRDFLEELGLQVVQRDLYLGNLRGPNGALIENWMTFRGKQRVIIRGSTNVSFRRCTECSRIVYFAMGKRYLFPSPSENADIFGSDLYGLVLRQQASSRKLA
jgi:hypothetical protein